MTIAEAAKWTARRCIALLPAVSILLFPSFAAACACCGLDDWWRVETIAPAAYEAQVLREVQLGPGEFAVAVEDMESWSISKVERRAKDFVFISEKGAFVFTPTRAPEHRMVDVTFITQPQYQLVDSADIYHEVVLVGVLRVPASLSKNFGRGKVDATLVLRGVGNMCFESGTLDRWLISSAKLRGSGALVREEPLR